MYNEKTALKAVKVKSVALLSPEWRDCHGPSPFHKVGLSQPLSFQSKMSFWRNFGFYTVSSIETTLNKPDFTLEDLLDDEEILQEVKAQNKKLIDVYVPLRPCAEKIVIGGGKHLGGG